MPIEAQDAVPWWTVISAQKAVGLMMNEGSKAFSKRGKSRWREKFKMKFRIPSLRPSFELKSYTKVIHRRTMAAETEGFFAKLANEVLEAAEHIVTRVDEGVAAVMHGKLPDGSRKIDSGPAADFDDEHD